MLEIFGFVKVSDTGIGTVSPQYFFIRLLGILAGNPLLGCAILC